MKENRMINNIEGSEGSRRHKAVTKQVTFYIKISRREGRVWCSGDDNPIYYASVDEFRG